MPVLTTMTKEEFEDFYDTHFRVVEWHARCILSDDIESIGIADFAMWYAFCHPNKFRDMSRTAIDAYLVKIARTRSYNELRTHSHHAHVDISEVENTVHDVSGENVERLVEVGELKESVKRYVCLLPKIYRDTLILRITKEMTVGEIAKAQGIPFNTAKTRCRRGMKMLKGYMITLGYDEL